MRRAFLMLLLGSSCCLPTAHTQDVGPTSDLQKIYGDESHCLLDNEVHSASDRPMSCNCRDALIDARYVYKTYFTTGKDPNLNGVYVALEIRASEICGTDNYGATMNADWKWNGPEVIRKYLSDAEVDRFTPDSKGWRHVPYEVKLIYHDDRGQVTKIELYTTSEAVPPTWKK